ncbi:hypothetical protein WAI453_013437 [Rhynchosporium graminicola]
MRKKQLPSYPKRLVLHHYGSQTQPQSTAVDLTLWTSSLKTAKGETNTLSTSLKHELRSSPFESRYIPPLSRPIPADSVVTISIQLQTTISPLSHAHPMP